MDGGGRTDAAGFGEGDEREMFEFGRLRRVERGQRVFMRCHIPILHVEYTFKSERNGDLGRTEIILVRPMREELQQRMGLRMLRVTRQLRIRKQCHIKVYSVE